MAGAAGKKDRSVLWPIMVAPALVEARRCSSGEAGPSEEQPLLLFPLTGEAAPASSERRKLAPNPMRMRSWERVGYKPVRAGRAEAAVQAHASHRRKDAGPRLRRLRVWGNFVSSVFCVPLTWVFDSRVRK